MYVAKTKVLISCTVTICFRIYKKQGFHTFYFSHDVAQLSISLFQMWNVTDPHMDTHNFEDTNLNWGLDSTHVEKVIESYPCCPGEYCKLHYTIKLVKKNRLCL